MPQLPAAEIVKRLQTGQPEGITAPTRVRPPVAPQPEISAPEPSIGGDALRKLRKGFQEFRGLDQPGATRSSADSALEFMLTPEGARLGIEAGAIVGEIAVSAALPQMLAARAAGTLPKLYPGMIKAARALGAFASGVGGSLAAEVVDPSVDPGSRALGMGVSNLVGEGVVQGLAGVGKVMLRPFAGSVDETVGSVDALLREEGSFLLAEQRSKASPVKWMGAIADVSLTGGALRTNIRKGQREAAEIHLNGFADGLAEKVDVDVLGEIIKSGFESRRDAWRSFFNQKYKELDALVEPEYKVITKKITHEYESPILDVGGKRVTSAYEEEVSSEVISKGGVDMKKSKALVAEFLTRIPDIGKSAGEAMAFLRQMQKGDDVLTFTQAHDLHSFLLDYTAPFDSPVKKRLQGMVGQLRKEISKSMETAADELGGEAGSLWKELRVMYKNSYISTFNGQLAKRISRAEPEAVYRALVKSRSPGTITKAYEIFGGENAPVIKQVRGYFFHDLLQSSVDAEGNMSGRAMGRILKNYGEETIKRLFPQNFKEIRNFVNVLVQAETSPESHAFQFIFRQAQLGTAIGLFAGGMSGTAGTILVVPEFLAWVMSNKKGVQWLTTGFSLPASSTLARDAGVKLTKLYQEWKDQQGQEEKLRVRKRLEALKIPAEGALSQGLGVPTI